MLRAAGADFKPDRAWFIVPEPVIRRWASLLISWTCAFAATGLVTSTHLATAQTAPTSAPIAFNIPSQPLGDALNRYVEATGLDALYDTSLAAGRVSGDVRGVFAADEALKKLLSGTGLTVEFVAATTFVLLPAPADQQAVQQARSPEHRRYYGLIQAGITDALCRSRGARPGRYRFTAVLWIASDGAVRRSRRIGSTGTPDADQRIDAALRNVRFNEPPPTGFLQPVLILIVPQGPEVVRGCEWP
ncbi:MAG: TonB-dependent outer membrane receptor [Rhodoplanes sp.]|uniref:STN domain-containing protein n=1 Tax=Rhodoplanes sp. TaxID=1968906 RepID=UPI0017F661F1|nr:STN domain-containing protein [Rhodoplanes sp.]NVO13586.1 TonB-dependent outer membrane receptor [Rhodoplanes sp.]